jgi:hypothetical protein
MLQKGPTFNHVLVNYVARLPKNLNSKFEKNENSLHGSPVGEGLFPLPTANGEAVGEADGTDTVWPRWGFANSFSFPTRMLLGKNPFANSRTLPSVLGFWAVGEDFFPNSRVFLLGKIFFANSSGLG